MAIKWRTSIKKVKPFVSKNKKVVLGGITMILGIVLMVMMFREIGAMKTKTVWGFGIIANGLIGTGVYFIFNFELKRRYDHWYPSDDSFYKEWKTKWGRQQKILLFIIVPLLLLALYIFQYQWEWGLYYGEYYNFAMGYLMVATVLLQSGIVEFSLIQFMHGRLENLMDCVGEVSKERLAAAIEMERESIEKEAKSEQLKIDLISNVSHDLKTPLTSMVGYIELIKKEEMSDITRDYVNVISDKAEKLKEMIESLFSLAKASSGNIKLEKERVEMNMLMKQIFADMSDRIEESGLEFVKIMTEKDTRLISDHMHLYRICQNLIENAIKYSAKGTRVFVKTFLKEGVISATEEKRVCLEITNTAAYMMDFDKDEIIERFVRGDKTRSGDGNGLGLAIVSTYTSALGGAFDISIDCDQFKATLSFPIGAI